MGGASSSASRFILVSFSHSVSIRLDNNNFLLWRKQVLAAIRGHKLQNFVFGTKPSPLRFLTLRDEEMDNVNPEFLDWEQQDQLLLSWLLSSMSEGILTHMVNCENSAQVWRTLERYFAVQIRVKVSLFKTQLRNTKKDFLTMNEYLLKIRGCIDFLGLVGHSMSYLRVYHQIMTTLFFQLNHA